MDLVIEPMSQQGKNYEVFLSFIRSEDTETQESFPSRLYSSLRKAGISVLKGDVSIELLPRIVEGSKISIIIFSKHYASSIKCLKELTKIMEFHRTHDQVVFPIFYGVHPSDVRNQESSFGQAFQDLIQKISPVEDEVSMWRRSLNEAARFYGVVVPYFDSKNENVVIQNIIVHVHYIVDMRGPFALRGQVGVSSQVQEVIAMLHKHRSKDVVSIGIWGMGGVGKTTIANIIFEHIQYEYEITCFLLNVRKVWESEGQVYLQRKLLSLVCEATNMRTCRIESECLKLVKGRACQKKVLLVLDNVNLLEQLHALSGIIEWFGKGSRIIITTRDLHLLRAFQVDDVYSMKLLTYHESLLLFSLTTFKRASPKVEFIELSMRMVAYTEGLPLALIALGIFLYGRSLKEWESALMTLNTVLEGPIHQILKYSFDSLNDIEKEIFIDIVLLYNGEDLNDVIQNLDSFGCKSSIGISALVDRSLVTIDKRNKLKMHSMLQLMGRQIIRESGQNKLQNRGHRFEVFLSFRGDDTRATFTSHLYTALCNASIVVFKDDVELPRGNHIKMELLQAIGCSKIAIIIFSQEYAGSKWCLEELSMIMELYKSNDQVVLPVFYNVDPSEIRNQTSSFGKSFKNLIERTSPRKDQVSKWRTALAKAASIAGIVVLCTRDESEKVTTIVHSVCHILDKKDLFVADHPVGVKTRVQEVITVLQNHQSGSVVMVGIWGMGGVGKTTIAKAIYNEIGRNFESRSYLSKIRKVWDQKKGQVRLQNQLLFEICRTTKIKINSIESGKITLRDRLCHKKALVVLDDVDKLTQLNALAGSPDWFKLRSIIIITTRNKRLLLQKGCHVYRMKSLDEGESIELFSWHAFKQESPKEDFNELSRNIVAYSGGLPLALEVLGSYLFGCEMEEWKSVLEKLQKIPDSKIQKKLKISFDGLSDPLEKAIFLDISCFFIGMDR